MNPVPDLLPISSSKINSSKMSIDRTDGNATFFDLLSKPYGRNDLETMNKFPDIQIIKRDSNTVDKSIPHDIPADIELIPMSSERSAQKRGQKRTFSPDNTITKISKLNAFNSSAASVSQPVPKFSQLKSDCSIEKVVSEHLKEAINNRSITMSVNKKPGQKIQIGCTLADTVLVPSSMVTNSSTTLLRPGSDVTIRSVKVPSEYMDRTRLTTKRKANDHTPLLDEILKISSDSYDQSPEAETEAEMEAETDVDAEDKVETEADTETDVETVAEDDKTKEIQTLSSNDFSEYSNDEPVVSSVSSANSVSTVKVKTPIPSTSTSSASGTVNDIYDRAFHSSASDVLLSSASVSTFDENSGPDDACTSLKSNATLDNIFKLQNFEGVLQIQPPSSILEQQPKVHSQLVDGDLILDDHDVLLPNNLAIGEDSSCSTAALADCSGDNSADTGVEELEPTIQNLQTLEDDPIEQKFTDAENYVLESGEISGDSGGKFTKKNKKSEL